MNNLTGAGYLHVGCGRAALRRRRWSCSNCGGRRIILLAASVATSLLGACVAGRRRGLE